VPVTVQSASLLPPTAASCCCSCARRSSSMWIGASPGIGQEFAPQAAANGINVVLLARREEPCCRRPGQPYSEHPCRRAVPVPEAAPDSVSH